MSPMTAVHEVSALLDAIDREVENIYPGVLDRGAVWVEGYALRDLVEAIDRLMTEPLEVTDAMVDAWLSQMELDAIDDPARIRAVLPVVLEAIAARMLPAVQRAAEAMGGES